MPLPHVNVSAIVASVLYRPHDDCTCYYVTWQHAGSEAYR